MIAIDRPQTVILLLNSTMLPLNTEGLKVSSGSKRRVIEQYQNALLFYRDGTVRKIEQIEFLGFYGKTFIHKIFSMANGATRRIATHLSVQEGFTIEHMRQLVIRSLRTDQQRVEPYFDLPQPSEITLGIVGNSTTASEIFDAIGVPAPEDALDALC